MTLRRLLAAAALTSCLARPLMGQASVSIGGTHASYAGSVTTNAVQAGVRYDYLSGNSHAGGGLNYAAFSGGGWATQGSADVVAASSGARNGNTFVAGVAAMDGNYLDGGTWAGQIRIGAVFAHRLGPLVGSAGFSLGRLRAIDSTTSGVVGSLASLQARVRGTALSLRLSGDHMKLTDYNDLELSAGRQVGIVGLNGAIGFRSFRNAPDESVWHAQAVIQPARALAFELSGGRNPTSPEGFDKGLYANAGIRLFAVGRAAAPPVVERIGAGRVRVQFELGNAREVSIAGDWNDWSPVPMNRDGSGKWSAELVLTPGAHKFVLVVDGKNVVPRGVPKLPDGFGGEAGLLVF